MNRANQLKEAIESCLACDLPEKTEFVIIDNDSTDNTEDVVSGIFEKLNYTYYYEKLEENIGAGRGRNYAFSKANGEYVYTLDDDAVIAPENYSDFFMEAIKILDDNADIISLTTQIYDTAWECYRTKTPGKKVCENVYKTNHICEGSNFLRKDFFVDEPYFPNTYGYEALPTVLKIYDKEKLNCYCSSILAIHQPLINKWSDEDENKGKLYLSGFSILYAIKQMMYPRIFTPFLYLAYKKRCYGMFKFKVVAKGYAKKVIRETRSQYKPKRIKFKTVLGIIKDYGLSAF